jgi:hypothetical protein
MSDDIEKGNVSVWRIGHQYTERSIHPNVINKSHKMTHIAVGFHLPLDECVLLLGPDRATKFLA